MDITALDTILRQCLVQVRKGDLVKKSEVGALDVTEIFLMPSRDEINPDIEVEFVDCFYIDVAVDRLKALELKPQFEEWLATYPELSHFAEGASYITVGALLGDQGRAFEVFALGTVLGLWSVMTPKALGVPPAMAQQMAGGGLIGAVGYKT